MEMIEKEAIMREKIGKEVGGDEKSLSEMMDCIKSAKNYDSILESVIKNNTLFTYVDREDFVRKEYTDVCVGVIEPEMAFKEMKSIVKNGKRILNIFDFEDRIPDDEWNQINMLLSFGHIVFAPKKGSNAN